MIPANSSRSCFTGTLYLTLQKPAGKILFALAIIALIGGGVCLTVGAQLPSLQSWLFTAGYSSFGFSGSFFTLLIPMIVYVSYKNYFSRYSSSNGQISIFIFANKRDIKNRPEVHLNKFTNKIKYDVRTHARALFSVSFHGLGAGQGLTREYLDDLLEGLTSKTRLFKKLETSQLAVPTAQRRDNLKTFEQLGQLMMYCYPDLPLGFHIDLSVFRIAFYLYADELNRFESLTLPRKCELYQILINAQIDPDLVRNSTDQQIINLLATDVHEWTEQEFIAAGAILGDDLPRDLEDEYAGLNIEVIRNSRQNKIRVKGLLIQTAAKRYDAQLRGIHAMARGMRSICRKGGNFSQEQLNEKWNTDFHFLNRPQTTQDFFDKLQGTIDRAFIVSKMDNGNGEEIQKKVRWLKQWIQDTSDQGAKEKEIRQLLKFITGASGLREADPNIGIGTLDGTYTPYPKAATCFRTLKLSPEPCGDDTIHDRDQDHFIDCIKFVISGEAADFAFG